MIYATDPSFTDAGAGDFTLQTGSPAIDAGNDADVPAGVTTDANGNTRIHNVTVDMGAYEFVTPAPEINIKQNTTAIASGSGSHNFGNVVVNATQDVVFTIENTGTADLTFTGTAGSLVVLGGTNAADFTVVQTGVTSPVAASGNQTFTVSFTPSSAGAKSASLTITSNDADEGTYTINLSGTGTTPTTTGGTTTTGGGSVPASTPLQPAPIAETLTKNLPTTPVSFETGKIIDLPPSINGTTLFYTIQDGKGVIVGNKLYLQGAGEVKVVASVDGYAPYPFTLQVTKGNQTLATSDLKTIPEIPQNNGSFKPDFGVEGVKFEIIEGQEFATVDANGNIVSTGKGIGEVKIKVWKPATDDFNVSETVQMTFNIVKSHQTITFDNISNRIFEANETLNLVASASSALDISFEAMTDNIEIQGNTLKITGGGVVKIKATQGGNDLYHPAPEEVRSFIVYKQTQTIVFAEIEDKVFGQAPFHLTASASSDLPVSFEIVNGQNTVQIEDGLVTILEAGAVTIRAIQNGNDKYSAAQSIIRTFTIYPTLALDKVDFDLESYRLNLSFSKRGNYGLSNQFVVQLSNENGEFTQHANLNARFDFNTNTVTTSIPERIVSSGKYHVRILASSPRTVSNVLPVIIELHPKPRRLSIEPEGTIVCASKELDSYQWYLRNAEGDWEAIEGATERCLDLRTISGRIEGNSTVVTVKGFIGNRTSDMASPYTYHEPSAGILATESDIINELRLYPNPTSGQFTVELTLKKAGDVQMRLVDALGKEIYPKYFENMPLRFTKSFDLQQFADGIYFLHIETPNGTVVRKIIKK